MNGASVGLLLWDLMGVCGQEAADCASRHKKNKRKNETKININSVLDHLY